jgi:hypothetical protein
MSRARMVAALAALALPSVACSAAPTAGATDTASRPAPRPVGPSDAALERFFPLVDGMIYQYETENDQGERGVLVARVARPEPTRGELRLSNTVKRFRFASDGVLLESAAGPVYLLKEPVTVGASFRGEHGGMTRIASTSATASVPAGHFDGCLQTIEERAGDRPVRYTSTYCAGTGLVLLEVASSGSFERASLRSYAAPVQMKPDGLERFPAEPPPPKAR